MSADRCGSGANAQSFCPSRLFCAWKAEALPRRYARDIASSVWNLKLVFVDTEDVDSDRANVIIEKLRTQRPVQGEEPEWKVAFEDVSQQRAFEELEQSLTTIDRDWGEVLMVYAA
jgi:hypothetical protein